jgi:hypothetical protein
MHAVPVVCADGLGAADPDPRRRGRHRVLLGVERTVEQVIAGIVAGIRRLPFVGTDIARAVVVWNRWQIHVARLSVEVGAAAGRSEVDADRAQSQVVIAARGVDEGWSALNDAGCDRQCRSIVRENIRGKEIQDATVVAEAQGCFARLISAMCWTGSDRAGIGRCSRLRRQRTPRRGFRRAYGRHVAHSACASIQHPTGGGARGGGARIVRQDDTDFAEWHSKGSPGPGRLRQGDGAIAVGGGSRCGRVAAVDGSNSPLRCRQQRIKSQICGSATPRLELNAQ